MRYVSIAILILVTCCGGCITRTVTYPPSLSSPDAKVVRSRTIWMWQKDFWEHK